MSEIGTLIDKIARAYGDWKYKNSSEPYRVLLHTTKKDLLVKEMQSCSMGANDYTDKGYRKLYFRNFRIQFQSWLMKDEIRLVSAEEYTDLED